ncbi:ABC transporter permease [Georgenia ruanii]|uniref:Autoinducer 2 import system permease protein LsrC n=1 Tax=Georgenia ruanii TaxID=348442 RepID=A0A7J9UYD5_9MICO|nr:ABC transporter permease [Georgenia ruanii]MPV89648.1 ABC transporter permease [Georgenia ruanii]
MTTTTSPTRRSLAAPAQPRTAPPWIWSVLGAVAVWLTIVAIGGGSGWNALSQVLTLAPFLVLVAIGQMLVITLGPGNIDVSVGAVVSLASYVSVIAAAATGSAVLGLLVGAAAGGAVGAASSLSIIALRVPPIIATLATSLIAASVTAVLADGMAAHPDAGLRAFVNHRVAGVPLLAVAVALLTVAVAWALRRTVYGRSVLATGQNATAAGKAGIPVGTTRAATYVLSGVTAGLAGSLLAAFISPAQNLGSSYLLDSVAVVVIGGTLIAGGRAVPAGLWGGALFFSLLSGLLNLVGWSVGAQNILKGVLVVLVVVISAGPLLRRRRSAPAASAPTTQTPSGAAPRPETTPTEGEPRG